MLCAVQCVYNYAIARHEFESSLQVTVAKNQGGSNTRELFENLAERLLEDVDDE